MRRPHRLATRGFLLELLYILGYTTTMPDARRFADVRRMLEQKGYTLARISGSHHVFTKPGELPVSIPVHKGKVKPYYVRHIEKL